MNVHNPVFPFFYKPRAYYFHIADKQDQLNLFILQDPANLFVIFLFFLSFWIKKYCFYIVLFCPLKRISIFFVAYDNRNPCIKLSGIYGIYYCLHVSRFCRCQNTNVNNLNPHEFEKECQFIKVLGLLILADVTFCQASSPSVNCPKAWQLSSGLRRLGLE